MGDPVDMLDAREVEHLRRTQRWRLVRRAGVILALAAFGVWMVSIWTDERVQLGGQTALAKAYRDYVTALRGPLPASWSIERVVRAHALAHAAEPYRGPRVPGLTEACHAIKDAEYDAQGDGPQAPCHGVDLAWGDCRLERLGSARRAAFEFAGRLRACEAELVESLEAQGRPTLSFGLDGEPLPSRPEPWALPEPPVGQERSGWPHAVPTALGTVVVDFVKVACEQPRPGSECVRHRVAWWGEDGPTTTKFVEPVEPVRTWWRVHTLVDGAVLLAGVGADQQLVLGRLGPKAELVTATVEGAGLPRSIVPLPGGAARVQAAAGALRVGADLRVETIDGAMGDPALRSAGPPESVHEPWRPEEVAPVGGGIDLQLRWADGRLVAERRTTGASETRIEDRVVVLDQGPVPCVSQSDGTGRVAVVCRQDQRYALVTSDDGGAHWRGRVERR